MKLTKKEKRRLHLIRREQEKTMIALKRTRKMDRELSAIIGPVFDSVAGLATMTVSEGFGKLTKLDVTTRKESPRHEGENRI